jgi:hypothetical protein
VPSVAHAKKPFDARAEVPFFMSSVFAFVQTTVSSFWAGCSSQDLFAPASKTLEHTVWQAQPSQLQDSNQPHAMSIDFGFQHKPSSYQQSTRTQFESCHFSVYLSLRSASAAFVHLFAL